jgi:hypothetical protein
MSTVTAKAPIKTNEIQDKGREMIFELVNRSNSQWVKRGTEHSPNPKHLNSPREYTLPMRSRKYLGNGQGYINTQYVSGANTIYVDDFIGADGKKMPGLKSQGVDLKTEYERSLGLGIKFLFGVLNLKKYGEDPILLDYVNNHEDNIETAAHTERAGKDPRKLQMFNFKPLRKEEKAQKAISSLEDDAAALNFVMKLRSQEKGAFVYNLEVIDAVCAIFDITHAFEEGLPNQKMEAIIALAKRNGKGFMEAINETTEAYRMDIATAMKYEVLLVTSKEAKLKIGAEINVIKALSGDNQEERLENLAYYFIGNTTGAQQYSTMCGETEVNKAKSINKEA